MPSAPSYPDAAFATVSWMIDEALGSDLESLVKDFISDDDMFYFDAVTDLPPPEPPPDTDPVTDILDDHDPSHIARLSTVLDLSPSITISFDLVRRELSSKNTITALLSTLDDLGCFPSISSGDAPLIVDCGASVFISSVRSDFINYEPSDIKIRGLGKQNKVAGKGMLRWHV